MIVKPYGRELMVGAFRDPVFGPVITFGEGGAHVEIQPTVPSPCPSTTTWCRI
jgi:acetyltransferase